MRKMHSGSVSEVYHLKFKGEWYPVTKKRRYRRPTQSFQLLKLWESETHTFDKNDLFGSFNKQLKYSLIFLNNL